MKKFGKLFLHVLWIHFEVYGSLAVIWFGISYIHWKGALKCGKRRCEVCSNVTDASTFNSTVTGDTFKINHSLNCDDKCLIYLMTCKQCNKQYTGETTDLFRNRWNNYKDNARKIDRKESCMQKHLYKHFQTEGHKGFLNEASVTFIDKTD